MVQGVPVITDAEEAVQAFSGIETWVAFDIETGGFSVFDPLHVVSLYHPAVGAAVVQVHDDVGLIRRLVEGKRLVGHNLAAFDLPFLLHRGVHVAAAYDTLIGERLVLKADRRSVKADLASVIERRLNREIDKTLAEHSAWSSELTDEALLYCVNDVRYLLELMEHQTTELVRGGKKEALLTEMGIVPVTAHIVASGMPIDEQEFLRLLTEARRTVMEREQALRDAGLDNVNSPMQVLAWLRRLGIEIADTRAEMLEDLLSSPKTSPEHREAVRAVLEAREARKRLMYDERWWEKYVDPDHRVRARYWQIGADTGRFSSSEPNFQQIPRTHRTMFRAPEGKTFVIADYSQIEIYVAAALAGEESLLRATVEGDVHSEVAQAVFGSVTKDRRQAAKAASFTLIFGGGVPGLRRAAHQLGIELTPAEASQVKAKYFSKYRKLSLWVSRTAKLVEQRRFSGSGLRVTTGSYGVDRTLFGDSLTPSRALNTQVQGTAAVGLKRALLHLKEMGLAEYVRAIVHDEIVAEAEEAEAEKVKQGIMEAMRLGMVDALQGHGIEVPIPPRVEAVINKVWLKE
jgi:DNA polymerase-1